METRLTNFRKESNTTTTTTTVIRPFYGQPALASTSSKELEYFAGAMFYCLHALSGGNQRIFRLGRRRWSSPQQCYLHCLHTVIVSKYHIHPLNGPLSRTTRVSQKSKTNQDFAEARDSEWQRHQLGHMQVCTLLQTDNHASTPPHKFFLQAGCPSCRPTNSVKALK